MRRILRALAAVLVIATFLPAVHARADTPPPSAIHLVYQDPSVKVGHSFAMVLHVDDPALAARPGASISITVGQSVSTRNGFDSAIASNALGSVLYQANPIPVASLVPFGKANVALPLGLPGSDAPYKIGIRNPGVYPLEVSLTNTGTPTSPFITWIVVVDNSSRPVPLLVAWIWHLAAAPASLPDGSTDPTVVSQMRPGGRLDRIATLLARDGRTPLSLLISPETVESWARLAARDSTLAPGIARVRTAAQRPTIDLLPTPYVPVDLPALEAAGLGAEYPREVIAGARSLHDVLGAFPTGRATFVDPSSDAAVDRLRTMLAVTGVAVRDAALQPVTISRTPAQAFLLDTSQDPPVQAVETAPFIEQLLDGPDPPAVKAQRVVAALAEVAYESPSIPRGVVIAPAADWSPDVDTMSTLLDALRNFSLVQPVTLDDLFTKISSDRENGADVHRRLRPTVGTAPPVSAAEYDDAAARLHAYEAVAGATDAASLAGEHALLVALSSWISPDRARDELARIQSSVDAFTNAVSVDARRIQLTSARASIPLSFENRLNPPRPITVVVHLESPKLVFPDGADRKIELKPGTTTLRAAADGRPFSVEARTSGTFALSIRITSLDGSLEFGSPARVTVRSTVFGRLAAPITIAALVVLAVWWGNHFRRSRRMRRTSTAPAT